MTVPDGEYDLVVEKSEVKITKTERSYLRVYLLIDSGEYNGTQVLHVIIPNTPVFISQIEAIMPDMTEYLGLNTVELGLLGLVIFDRRFKGVIKTDSTKWTSTTRLVYERI